MEKQVLDAILTLTGEVRELKGAFGAMVDYDRLASLLTDHRREIIDKIEKSENRTKEYAFELIRDESVKRDAAVSTNYSRILQLEERIVAKPTKSDVDQMVSSAVRAALVEHDDNMVRARRMVYQAGGVSVATGIAGVLYAVFSGGLG